MARFIYDKHISEDCGEPVNLPQHESKMILKSLESEQCLSRFLFDDAAQALNLNFVYFFLQAKISYTLSSFLTVHNSAF